MYADAMENLLKLNEAETVSHLILTYPDHDKTLRGLFKRSINIVKNQQSKVTLADLWLEWEKKFGSIATLE